MEEFISHNAIYVATRLFSTQNTPRIISVALSEPMSRLPNPGFAPAAIAAACGLSPLPA